MSVTASDLIDKILRRLDEEPSAPVFWSRAEILAYLNEAMVYLNLITHRQTDDASHTLDMVPYQSTPSTAVAVMSVRRSSTGRPLWRYTLESLEKENHVWATETGTIDKWFPLGLNLFGVHKLPATAGDSVTLTILQLPTTLTENSTIDFEDEYVESLEDYVFHVARFKEGGEEFQNSFRDLKRSHEKSAAAMRFVSEHYLRRNPQSIHASKSGYYFSPPAEEPNE